MPSKRVTDAEIEDALRRTGGIISAAALLLEITPRALRRRLKRSARLQQAQKEAVEGLLDRSEMVLAQKLQQGDLKAAMYYLDRRGADRGYSPKTQLSSAPDAPLNISISDLPDVSALSEEERALLAKIVGLNPDGEDA